MTIMKLLPTLELDNEIDLISFLRNSIEKLVIPLIIRKIFINYLLGYKGKNLNIKIIFITDTYSIDLYIKLL